MNLDKLQAFIKLAKEENVAQLSYEDKESKMKVSLVGGGNTMMPMVNTIQAPAVSSAEQASNTGTSAYKEIKSPFVGTFYSASAPDKPAYVKVGDKVSVGQTLCILEAMKIMNEIESDVAGEIVEICVSNESLVEYGQVLFKIK